MRSYGHYITKSKHAGGDITPWSCQIDDGQRIRKLVAIAHAQTPEHTRKPNVYPPGFTSTLAAHSYANMSCAKALREERRTHPPSMGPTKRARLTALCAMPLANPTTCGGDTEGMVSLGVLLKESRAHCSSEGWRWRCN